VRNTGRRLCVWDTGQKWLAALEVDWLAGVPTILTCAVGALLVFATNLEDTINLLGNREVAEAAGNLKGKWRDVGGQQWRWQREQCTCGVQT
jgi:hypothetical protein